MGRKNIENVMLFSICFRSTCASSVKTRYTSNTVHFDTDYDLIIYFPLMTYRKGSPTIGSPEIINTAFCNS